MTRTVLAAALAVFGLLTGACRLDVERNTDGSLQIEAVISEADIATEIAQGMDAREADVTVDLREGYAIVEAEGPTARHPYTETFSFRLELYVNGDHLGAEVSDALWNGLDVPEELVAAWNEDIAASLERAAKKNPDSTLVGVDITNDELRFEFHVETPRSKA